MTSSKNKNLPAKTKEKDDDVTVSDEVIEDVYEHLKEVFIKHIHSYMLESGQYIVTKFYGDYETAQKKKFTQTKSMSKLIKKIQDNAAEGQAPSRTWVYDAVNLAIDNYLFEQKQLSSEYGQLGYSHKMALTYAPDIKTKNALIEECIKNKYIVAKLRERITEEKTKNKTGGILLHNDITEEELNKITDVKSLKKIKTKLKKDSEALEIQLNIYKNNLEKVKRRIVDIED